jgi:hypothetical protein
VAGGRHCSDFRSAVQPPHISCLGSAHLVLGFGSSHARLLSPHTFSCSASAHLMPSYSTPTHLVLRFCSSRAQVQLILCSAARPPLISCSNSAHLMLGFHPSHAQLRLISCPAAHPQSNNERLKLCNSLSDEGDYLHTLSSPSCTFFIPISSMHF